ncbi:MAG: HK97 gp10 family phage protein [Candidatus Eisenbacteria bacterium]
MIPLSLTTRVFATPGIVSLMAGRPDLRRRVQAVVAASALRVQSGAKQRSPVDTGRMKTSITIRFEHDGLEAFIGTNVVSLPSGVSWSRRRGFRVKPGGKTSGGGYHYPRRQEFDESLSHTTGEVAFHRKALAAEKEHFEDQCRRALIRGLKGEV